MGNSDGTNAGALIHTNVNADNTNSAVAPNTANSNAANVNVTVPTDVNSGVNNNDSTAAVNDAHMPTTADTHVTIQATADKNLYHSNENISLDIALVSDQGIANVIVSASGIESRYGTMYFNKTETVSLNGNQPVTVTFTSTLPSCSSCSGIEPGDYTIDITAT